MIKASKEDLKQRPGHVSREWPLFSLMKGADVEGKGVPQRCRREARYEGVVHVKEIDPGVTEQRLDPVADIH